MTSSLTLAVISAAILALCSDTTAQDPVLVEDINKRGRPTDSTPNPGLRGIFYLTEPRFASAPARAFAVADEGKGAGREPYLVLPFANQKVLLKDIRPGSASSMASQMTLLGNTLWFVASDGTHGFEIWTSDGTPQGTKMLTDLAPGNESSFASGFTQVGKYVVFSATRRTTGHELYVSDGTAKGTGLLKDLYTGSTFLSGAPRDFVRDAAGTRVYFTGTTRAHGRELWSTDGTQAGTRLVADLAAGAASSNPMRLEAFGNGIVFEAGQKLYRFDGSRMTQFATTRALTELLVETTPTPRVLFVDGKKILTSDGTTNGTKTLADLSSVVGLTKITKLRDLAGSAFAFFCQLGRVNYELWYSDGTAKGTRRVTKIISNGIRDAVASGGSLFYSTIPVNSSQKTRLWISNGTANGTRVLPGRAGFDVTNPRYVTKISPAHVLFAGEDTTIGKELFVATAGGIAWSVDIKPPSGPNQGSYPFYKTVLGDKILFRANDGWHGREPYVHDTTSGTTKLLRDLRAGGASSDPMDLVRLGNRVLFSAEIRDKERELWITDGTTRGTRVLADLNGSQSTNPRHLTRIGDRVYFAGGSYNTDLYVTDGTTKGTKRLVDLPNRGNPLYFTPVGKTGGFVFSAIVGGRYSGIWYSDGTAANTKPISDPLKGPLGIAKLTRVGERVFYDAMFPGFGRELGVTDGTKAGTKMFMDLNPGLRGSEMFGMTPHGDGAFFHAIASLFHPTTFWTDGTVKGTKPRPLTNDHPWGVRMTSAGSRRLLLTRFTKPRGLELWTTDGTKSGTKPLKEIYPGPKNSNPIDFVEVGGSFYFTAEDPTRGHELWKIPIGAVSLPAGSGCTTRGVTPTLSIDDALLGKSVSLRCRRVAPGSILVLTFGARDRHVALTGIAARCTSFVDLTKPFVALPAPMPSATWSATLPIPSDRTLNGVSLAWQGFFVGGKLPALEATNGVHTTLGAR